VHPLAVRPSGRRRVRRAHHLDNDECDDGWWQITASHIQAVTTRASLAAAIIERGERVLANDIALKDRWSVGPSGFALYIYDLPARFTDIRPGLGQCDPERVGEP
jgi:hypothetical protein